VICEPKEKEDVDVIQGPAATCTVALALPLQVLPGNVEASAETV
jgi:hypothetical protein